MQKTVSSNYGLVLFNPLIGPVSGVTTLGPSGPGSDGNKGVLHIPQYYLNFTIRLFSVISRTLVGVGSYPSAEKQSVYSTAPDV